MLKHVRHGSLRNNSVETPSSPSDDQSFYSTPSIQSGAAGYMVHPDSLPQLDTSAYIDHWRDRLCSPTEEPSYAAAHQGNIMMDLPPPVDVEGGFTMPQISSFG